VINKSPMLSDDLAELAAGLDRLQPAVEVDGGFEAFVPEEAPDRFVVARMVLQVDRRGGMPKLVDGNPQSGGLLDSLRNLDAKQMRILGFTVRIGEEPIAVPTAQ